MLGRYGVQAESRFLGVPSVEGQAHVLVSGDGPAVVIINGIGIPAAMWAPLLAELDGFRLFAVDLPAYGLTDTTLGFASDLRRNAVRFLEEVLDGLGLEAAAFVANSLGSLWASWLALAAGESEGDSARGMPSYRPRHVGPAPDAPSFGSPPRTPVDPSAATIGGSGRRVEQDGERIPSHPRTRQLDLGYRTASRLSAYVSLHAQHSDPSARQPTSDEADSKATRRDFSADVGVLGEERPLRIGGGGRTHGESDARCRVACRWWGPCAMADSV